MDIDIDVYETHTSILRAMSVLPKEFQPEIQATLNIVRLSSLFFR